MDLHLQVGRRPKPGKDESQGQDRDPWIQRPVVAGTGDSLSVFDPAVKDVVIQYVKSKTMATAVWRCENCIFASEVSGEDTPSVRPTFVRAVTGYEHPS